MTGSRKSKIYFFFEKETRVENRSKLKKFLESIFKRERKDLGSVNLIFCSDHYLRAINRDYLQHDYYTDIVTFKLSAEGEPLAGEIYISVDRVFEKAMVFRVTKEKELHRVIIHGVLHLCGYSDKTKANKNRMTVMEDRYLAGYF